MFVRTWTKQRSKNQITRLSLEVCCCVGRLVKAAGVLDWCVTYQTDLICPPHWIYPFHCVEEFLCPSTSHNSGEVEKQPSSLCWQTHRMFRFSLWLPLLYIQSIVLLHMNTLNNKDKKSGLPKWRWQKTHPPPQGDVIHQKWPSPHPDVAARMKMDFTSVFSALELCSLASLGQVFNSLCNLPVYLAKKNNSDLMLGHDLEYLRNYKTALRLKIVSGLWM